MDSKQITRSQARAVAEALFPSANYLVRLRRRMEERGFPPEDDLYRDVCAAQEAVNRLRMKVHYLSCSGVDAPAGFGNKTL